jgi:IclR family transcriptional regulator, KDG regulon repressor
MGTLETALDILDCFHPDSPELAVTEVARRLGIPKSTASRVLKTMAHRGLTEQSQDSKRYSVGPLPLRLGQLYRARTRTLDLVAAAVERLAAETRFTGYVGVLDGADLVILRMTQGRYPVRIVLEPGYRVPAFATAMGLALLARETDAELRTMLPTVMVHAPTGLRKSLAALLRDLEAVRRQGWADVSEATFPGIRAVAAAVGGAQDSHPIGLALSFPVGAADAAEHVRIVAQVTAAADRIAAQIGDPVRARAGAISEGAVAIVPRRAARSKVSGTRKGSLARTVR